MRAHLENPPIRQPDLTLATPANSAARVAQFAWPYRWRLLTSVVCAGLVAATWSATLLLAFPVMKVVLQGKTVTELIDQEISEASPDASTEDRLPAAGLYARARAWKLHVLAGARTHIASWVPQDAFATVLVLLATLLALTVLKGAVRYVQEVLVASVVEQTVVAIRQACYQNLLALDFGTVARWGTPQLMSRFTFDMNVMAKGLSLIGIKLIREPLKASACVVCAFVVNWQLTLLSVLIIPVVGVVFYGLGRALKKASHSLMNSMSRIYSVLEETLDAIRVIIAFGGADRQRQRFEEVNREYYVKAMTIAKIDALTSPAMEILAMLSIFVGLLPGAYLVLREQTSIWGVSLTSTRIDLAELVLVYTLLAGVVDPGRKLASIYAKVKRAHVAADRVFALMDARPSVIEPQTPVPLAKHCKSIVFEKVQFGYLPACTEAAPRKDALRGVTMQVEAGEFLVLVGPSGSGKTSLISLLPRFYDPQQGAVKIDGTDIRSVALSSLRSQIAIVTQDTILFDDSILENIRYGCPGASLAEVAEAAARASILPFINHLPDGFQTRIGAKGAQLSGGQRQRLALARAFLRRPEILLLDEPTSSVDVESEQLIQAAITDLAKQCTTLLITHTLSPGWLGAATRIAVMDAGRVVAVGPHESLVNSCGIYARLVKAQMQRSAA